MKSKIEDLGEVFLYFINHETIDRVKNLFPENIAEEIRDEGSFGLVISEENEIKGGIAASFDGEENILDIRSLFVLETARRRALGSTLLLQLVEAVIDETEGELRAVTCSFLEDTSGLKELLEKIGFILEEEEGVENFFISREQLENSILNGKEEEDSFVLSLDKLSEYERKELYHHLEEEEAAYISLKDLKEMREDLSFVILGQNRQVQACSLLSGKENLVLRQFYAAKGNSSFAVRVLRASVRAMMKDEHWNKSEVPCLTPSSARLLKKLTGVKEEKKYIRGILRV